MDKKLLIIGGSGYFGSALPKTLGKYQVLRTYNKNKIGDGIFFDLSSSNITDIVNIHPNIDLVIIMAGTNKFAEVNQNPEKARFINVTCTKRIINELNDLHLFPIFISSESVFDGKKGNYVESDRTNPTFEYGNHKDLIEKFIIQNCNHFQILRISKIFDSDLFGDTLITNWIKKLDNDEDIYCANDNVFSPIHLNDLCELFKRIINNNKSGIYHICSSVRLNRKDMLNMVLDNYLKYNHYTGNIYYQSLHEFSGAESQPLDTSMNPTKAISEARFQPKSFDKWIKPIIKKNSQNKV